MSESKKQSESENLPRLVCAFAGLFALGVPAFSVIVGARVHAAVGEFAVENALRAGTALPEISVRIFDAAQIASWVLLAAGFVAAISLFALMRKNSAAGTLRGAGRVTVALGLTGALSAFYLAALLLAVAFSL